ncbi:MAG: hypothetical protein AAFP89_23050 [Bacteroidota bacterium]
MRFFVLLFLLGMIHTTQAQFLSDSLQRDTTAENFIEQGKYFLSQGSYDLAAQAFQAASRRPDHQATSTARYFLGLSHYFLQDWRKAERYFMAFAKEYTDSKYREDALYHLAVMGLRDSVNFTQKQSLAILFDLVDSATTQSLRQDAYLATQQYLFFEVPDDSLELWMLSFDTLKQTYFVEALAHHYYQQERFSMVGEMYQYYQESFGLFSPFVETMIRKEPEYKYVGSDVLKVAVVIPANWGDNPMVWEGAEELPKQKLIAMEWVEGFLMGLEDSLEGEAKVYVEIMDSERDSMTMEEILTRLDVMEPDLVIGDIFNRESRQLSAWCEARATTQIIPLSPSSSLSYDKSHVLVAHPSAQQHAEAMAIYARQFLLLDTVVVWSDGGNSAKLLAFSFQQLFDTLGGKSILYEVPLAEEKEDRKEITQKVRELKVSGADGVYIPIQGQQETAGLIVSQMQALDVDMKIMGGPHWGDRYSNIDRDLKERYKLLYTSSYFLEKGTFEVEKFFQSVLKTYGYPPSQYMVQGFDLGKYTREVLADYVDQSLYDLGTFIRNHPVTSGLHMDMDFRGQAVNQSVNILQYSKEGVKCINCEKKSQENFLFITED